MNSRKQFEAWLNPLWHLETFKGSDDSLQYRDEVIQGKWEAWQAASKASEQQLSESRREFTAANATIHNLELKVAQVVAENAALKAFGTKLDEMHNDLNGEGTGIQGRAEVVCQQVALEAAMEEFDAIKTPATDAYLAEVLAHGVEMFAGELTGNFQQCTDDEFIREAAKRFAIGAKRFAAQLRQGAEQ